MNNSPKKTKLNTENWHKKHVVLIMGYEKYRNLSEDVLFEENELSSDQKKFQEIFINPGPDLVVCDEGHLLKNDKTSISDAISKVRTMRRIILTGTPLQNNLNEYFCMVNLVKPDLLGTTKEFTNRFINPIMNGQYANSTPHDMKLMKRRTHVLHKLLDGVFHRADISVLAPFLQPKEEYVIYIRLTDIQVKLYKVCEEFSPKSI